MRFALGLLTATVAIVGGGCGRSGPGPDVLYQQGRAQLRLGNLNGALARAEQGWAAFCSQPQSLSCWQFRILKAEALLAKGAAKDVLSSLEAGPPAGPQFAEIRARRRMAQGHAHFQMARYVEARQILDDALQLAASGPPGLVAEIEMRKSSALARLGESAAAERSVHRALDIALREGDLYLQAAGYGSLGYKLMQALRYDEAVPWFEKALAASQQTGARKFIASTLGNLGRCYYGLGDYEKAIQLYSRAEAMAAEMGILYSRQIWLGDIGQAYDEIEEFQKAIPYYRQAMELSQRIGETYSTVEWLMSLATSSLALKDIASAERYTQEALALSGRKGLEKPRIWAQLRAAQVAMAKKDFAAAEAGFRAVAASGTRLEQIRAVWEAQAELARLHAETGQPQRAEAEFRQTLSSIETTRAKLARDEWQFSFQTISASVYRDYVDFLMARGQAERALEVAESSRARVLAQKLGLRQSALRLAPASRFRAIARDARAVLVSFWLAPHRSFAWLVTPERVESVVLPPERELKALVQAYGQAIQGLRDPLETANPAGRRLYDLLLQPVARKLPRGSRIVVVPDGCLHELNLEALPVESARPHYWIEDVSVAIAPTLSLLAPQPATEQAQPRSLLLIGDPLPAADYPRLPEAAAEVSGVGSRFAPDRRLVLTGASAHPGVYREAKPARFSFIHFSAHATANRESPLESAVILSPEGEEYRLYARDVIGLPLEAELVTISACRGAGARLYAGEGLVGFAWAFLQAGARNVIAGLWDVNDRSTAQLMEGLYERLAAGDSPAGALRAAKLALARSGGPFRKPYYWAPFQLLTRSSSF